MQKLMGLLRRCVEDYDMIADGDKIAVGVSGGKDSLVLLKLMAELRRYHNRFQMSTTFLNDFMRTGMNSRMLPNALECSCFLKSDFQGKKEKTERCRR